MWVSLVSILIKKKFMIMKIWKIFWQSRLLLRLATYLFSFDLYESSLKSSLILSLFKSHGHMRTKFNFRGSALGNSLMECLFNSYRRGLLLIYINQVSTDYVLETFDKSKWRYEKSSNITKCTNPLRET